MRAAPRVPVTVARPEGDVPRNVGVGGLAAGAQPWSTDGGQVQVTVVGDSGAQAPLSLAAGDRPARQALATVGGAVQVAIPGAPAGWYALTRARSSPTNCGSTTSGCSGCAWRRSRARLCAPAGRFAEAACDVLRANGRLRAGR